MIKNNLIEETISIIKKNIVNDLHFIKSVFFISKTNISYKILSGSDIENLNPFNVDLEMNFDFEIALMEKCEELFEAENKFNKLEIIILPDGNYKKKYYWDEEKAKEEKLISAKYFYQWANDTMMNRIFDYEKENNLLTPIYDEDGDVYEYEDSWDIGKFTFKVKDNKITHQIILSKNNVIRNLAMPLPQYYVDGLLEHFNITNKELVEEWKPWNVLEIKSPNNRIPYNDWESYVNYSLENKDV